MATTKRESNLGKEKRGSISPSNPSTTKKSTSGSVPNYLRPTVSSRTETGPTTTKTNNNAKKTGPGPEPNPNLLRRRSFDRPPSAAPRVHRALISPAREKPAATRSVSFSSKSNASASKPNPTSERVVKKPNTAAKPQSTLSSSRSMKKTTNSSSPATTKKPALKKQSSSRDKHEEQDVEITKLETETEEVLDHQDHVDEILNNDLGDPVDYSESPKADENEHHHDEDVLEVATEVKSDDEVKNDHSPGAAEVSEEHNIDVIPETEEIEEKIHEEEESDQTDQHDEDHKENEIKEEIDDEQEKIPDEEEAKTETEEEKAEEEVVAAAKTEELEEEKQVESREQETSDEGSKEEKVEEEKNIEESKPETPTAVVKSQAPAAHGKKESATPYNDVIEETASKLREARKNKVLALVGAFETVIDKETSNAK